MRSAAASLAECLYGYALVCTRVRGNIRVYSLLETGTSVLHVICAVTLGWMWGLAGAFAGLTLAILAGLAVAAQAGRLASAAPFAALPVCAVCLGLSARPPSPRYLRPIGWTLLGATALTAAILVAALG